MLATTFSSASPASVAHHVSRMIFLPVAPMSKYDYDCVDDNNGGDNMCTMKVGTLCISAGARVRMSEAFA